MLKKILINICIIMLLAFFTLLIIDQINSAMGLVNNQITKTLMLIMMPVTVITLFIYIADIREEERRAARQSQRRRPIERAQTPGRHIESAQTPERPIERAQIPERRRYDR